jgi:hypothetical protein
MSNTLGVTYQSPGMKYTGPSCYTFQFILKTIQLHNIVAFVNSLQKNVGMSTISAIISKLLIWNLTTFWGDRMTAYQTIISLHIECSYYSQLHPNLGHPFQHTLLPFPNGHGSYH